MNTRITTVLAIPILLTACGTTPQDRAIGGAGVGAATGAVVGAVTGLSVVQGAVLGAAGGALTGALTDERQVNLGDPAWKSASADGGSATVRDIQAGLNRLGHDAGPVDGYAGPKTAEAIRAYQRKHGLLVDGQPSAALAEHIGGRS